MTGFRGFLKIFASLCFWMKVDLAAEGLKPLLVAREEFLNGGHLEGSRILSNQGCLEISDVSY